MSAEHVGSAADCYEAILETYERLGFPREVVTNWTLPKSDVNGLLAQFDPTRPLRVLEVGTFVGLSTLLIAAHCHPGTRIHTVDPNFPLAVELDSMKTPLASCDPTMRQQALAALAAREMGFAERIVFHAGGFATGATFASARDASVHPVPVVGTAVCAEHGPFDVIFLDGLHYESTVHADLVLAAAHLADGGRIVLHDVIGRWGSNVRRAAWRFVEDNPGFRFRHGRYSSIYDAIGVVERSDAEVPTRLIADEPPTHPGLDNPEYRRNLATALRNRCAPSSAVLIGGDPTGFASDLREVGLARVDVCGVAPAARADLAVLADVACDMQRAGGLAAIDAAVATADTVLLVTTPPGEDVAPAWARPIGWWATQFLARGYALHDELRPDFEPLRFAYSTNTLYRTCSSRDCNVYLARRLPAGDDVTALRALLVEKERRIEDLTVQGVYTDFLLGDTVQRWISAADHYQRALAEIERLKATPRATQGLFGRLRRRLFTNPT